MTTVTLYEKEDGTLYLHRTGEPMAWSMSPLSASTFLTDAMVVANGDTAAHPDIFSTPIVWNSPPTEQDADERDLLPIAVLQLNPEMGVHGAVYTLFQAD